MWRCAWEGWRKREGGEVEREGEEERGKERHSREYRKQDTGRGYYSYLYGPLRAWRLFRE